MDDNLKSYGEKHKINTLRGIITRWAPPKDEKGNVINDTEAYINTVCKHSGIGRKEVICKNDKAKIIAIIGAMSLVENGVKANYNDIEKGWILL